jgi:hypothetical protein
MPPMPGIGDGASPGVPGPDGDSLHALLQRLSAVDPESALELGRLLAASQQAGEWALALAERGRAPVGLAWLRRLSREVDTGLALWHRVQPHTAEPPAERRASDLPPPV